MNRSNWNLNSMANYAGLLLQCSTIKRTAWFEEIDAVKTSTPQAAFRLRSGRDLEAQNMPQVREFIPPKCSMFWRVRQRNIISAVDRICPL